MAGGPGAEGSNKEADDSHRGRLRRQAGGRRHVVFLRLSEREATVLTARATRAGVSVQRFLLESALVGTGQTVTERHALYRTLLAARRTVAGAANNLNQLARVANATGRVPAELGALTEALERGTAALEASLAALGRRPGP